MDVKLTALTIAIATGLALPAMAERGPLPRGAGMEHRPAFADLDANGDGALTPEEIQAFGTARFSDSDTNGDGELSAEEMNAAILAKIERHNAERTARMIERLDQDGNGTLSQAEMEARMKAPHAQRMFEKLDADADGTISAEEYAAMEQRGPGKGPRFGPRHGAQGERGHWK